MKLEKGSFLWWLKGTLDMAWFVAILLLAYYVFKVV